MHNFLGPSDPKLTHSIPRRPFKILPGGRAIAWDEGEINAHLARQMAERKQQRIA
jgi:hypothetical protein